MQPWYTRRWCESAAKSHTGHKACDGPWYVVSGNVLERSEYVVSRAGNDHRGFGVRYIWNGAVRGYRPDYLVRMKDGVVPVLKTRGGTPTGRGAEPRRSGYPA